MSDLEEIVQITVEDFQQDERTGWSHNNSVLLITVVCYILLKGLNSNVVLASQLAQ